MILCYYLNSLLLITIGQKFSDVCIYSIYKTLILLNDGR